MARITVEDCIDKISNRFELVLLASQRSRKLHTGEKSEIERQNDKDTVIALREIEEESIKVEDLKENVIKNFQTVSYLESENEDENDKITQSESSEKQQNIKIENQELNNENDILDDIIDTKEQNEEIISNNLNQDSNIDNENNPEETITKNFEAE